VVQRNRGAGQQGTKKTCTFPVSDTNFRRSEKLGLDQGSERSKKGTTEDSPGKDKKRDAYATTTKPPYKKQEPKTQERKGGTNDKSTTCRMTLTLLTESGKKGKRRLPGEGRGTQGRKRHGSLGVSLSTFTSINQDSRTEKEKERG